MVPSLWIPQTDRQSLAERSFNNPGTVCWSAGAWFWIYPCVSNQELSPWLNKAPLPEWSSTFCSSLRDISFHIIKCAQLLYVYVVLLKTTVIFFFIMEMLCLFFLPLPFDPCSRDKGRACNDHHCFMWLLSWQPSLMPPVAHALPYHSSNPAKTGFHGYSFRAPLWLNSWKCWLCYCLIPARVNVYTHVGLLLQQYIMLATRH